MKNDFAKLLVFPRVDKMYCYRRRGQYLYNKYFEGNVFLFC